MHDRGHKGLRGRAAGAWGWLRRRWRRATLVVAVLALVPVGSDAARSAMAGDWAGLGGALGTSVSGDVDFDEITIDEPLPDDVVDAGFAPDPEFFSDDEITDGLGDDGIPEVALDAYLDGADLTNSVEPECGLPWSVLAAIGRVESNHGQFDGSQLRVDGYGTKPIRGIALDGRPGIALVRDTDRGALDGDDIYDRAVGPMQIIPSTWDAIGVDANDDGRTDPNNIFDAAWGAGIYLCNGDVDLTEPGQLARAVRRYNHTDEYVRVVLQLASAYDSGEIAPAPGVDPASLGETPMDPVVFEDFESVDPAPVPRSAAYTPPAPAPDPSPAPAPAPAPSPPAPTPSPAPSPTTTAPPAPPTTTPTPPTTPPGSPDTTTPPAPPTTSPSTSSTSTSTTSTSTTSTTVPDGGSTTSTTSPAGDTSSSIPPASVGWSPTMLDFVTTTVAERAAECSAPGSSPVPTQPSVPASNPPCPAATPPDEQQG